MAFRASKSTSASTAAKKSKTAPAEGVIAIDDIVGTATTQGDKKQSPELEQQAVSPDAFVAPPAASANPEPPASFRDRGSAREPMRGGRPGFDTYRSAGSFAPRSGGYGNYRRGPSSYGGGRGYGHTAAYRDRGPADGGPTRFGGETGYRRTDWSGSSDQAHTQDINVPTETVRGILDVMPEGHGFLRPKFTPSERDVYISQSQIRRFTLRNGDMVEGQARQPKDNERYWGLLKVEKINEVPAEDMTNRPRFDDLTAIYPDRQLKLESGQIPLSTRIIDLVAPVGFGQRALIVSPPKAGKTTILKELAAGIAANYPDVHLMAALIGERPEEVTDLTRSIKGEVLASNFDQPPPEQTRVAEVALDRAKRLVEMGKDVVVLLDSITRLARAYNLVVNPSGRTLSGGFDPAALYPAKKFLGAARCVEKQVISEKGEVKSATEPQIGGSLTVIGTALVDTGSRMDDMIYEEFKGTGNMELTLSRALQERRIFPAIDVGKSGTRHDELLVGVEKMKQVTTLRHMLSLLSDEERTMMLVDRLGKTKSNDEFLESLSQGA